ncbi:hypothetical protein CEXT_48131 [Caerostris extrusa]|uniref:Uncharacterized protein n=1 Tax=Caerostris extrusa TaxID=172846 RepID=A0AAV4WR06_CAEEX|nr:hypothetical protein CEXT_48131 [Caerostris extrusa]
MKGQVKKKGKSVRVQHGAVSSQAWTHLSRSTTQTQSSAKRASRQFSRGRARDTEIIGKHLKRLKHFDCTSKEKEEPIKFKNPPIKEEATPKKKKNLQK